MTHHISVDAIFTMPALLEICQSLDLVAGEDFHQVELSKFESRSVIYNPRGCLYLTCFEFRDPKILTKILLMLT